MKFTLKIAKIFAARYARRLLFIGTTGENCISILGACVCAIEKTRASDCISVLLHNSTLILCLVLPTLQHTGLRIAVSHRAALCFDEPRLSASYIAASHLFASRRFMSHIVASCVDVSHLVTSRLVMSRSVRSRLIVSHLVASHVVTLRSVP